MASIGKNSIDGESQNQKRIGAFFGIMFFAAIVFLPHFAFANFNLGSNPESLLPYTVTYSANGIPVTNTFTGVAYYNNAGFQYVYFYNANSFVYTSTTTTATSTVGSLGYLPLLDFPPFSQFGSNDQQIVAFDESNGGRVSSILQVFCNMSNFSNCTDTGWNDSNPWPSQYIWATSTYPYYSTLSIKNYLGSTTYQGGSLAQVASSTSILTVTPAGGSTISSTTAATLGVTGNLSINDISQDFFGNYQNDTISLSYSANGLTQCNGVDLGELFGCSAQYSTSANPQGTFSWQTDISGPFSFSTTTPNLPIGTYTLTASVSKPNTFLGLSIGGSSIVSTTTTFTVGTTTQFNATQAAVGQVFQALTSEAASSTISFDTDCNPFGGSASTLFFNSSFSPTKCVLDLTIPSTLDLQSDYQVFQTTILQKAPFGYITRLWSIINESTTTASTSLPSLTATLPSGFPGAGQTLTLDPWNVLAGPGSLMATATSTISGGLTLNQLILPYWNDLVVILFFLEVFRELLGLFRGSRKQEQS